LPVIGTAFILLIWHLLTDVLNVISEHVFPTPAATVGAFLEFHPLMLEWLRPTLTSAAVGFSLALALATVLGFLITLDVRIENSLMPLALAGNSVPRVTLAPVILFYFGTGLQAKYLIAAWIAFFPTLVNIVDGLKQIEREQDYLLTLLQATTWQEYRYMRIPNALPYIFDAMKFAATLSFIGAILGEFVSQTPGLGFLVLVAMGNQQLDLVIASIALMGIIGTGVTLLIFALQDKIVFWREAKLLD
jgi:NitT/TauT family transport system permease protein